MQMVIVQADGGTYVLWKLLDRTKSTLADPETGVRTTSPKPRPFSRILSLRPCLNYH